MVRGSNRVMSGGQSGGEPSAVGQAEDVLGRAGDDVHRSLDGQGLALAHPVV